MRVVAVLNQFYQEPAMIIGNDVLGETLVLLVNRIIILAVIINGAKKTCDLTSGYSLDMRTRDLRDCSKVPTKRIGGCGDLFSPHNCRVPNALARRKLNPSRSTVPTNERHGSSPH